MTVIFPKSTVAFARSGFVLLFLFIVVQTGFSQWGTDTLLNSHMRQGINYVYNLDFDNATKDFGELIRLKPENPAGYFFMAMIDWEKILLDLDNTSHDEQFLSAIDRVIDVCDKQLDKNEDDVEALFFKGGAIGFRGRLRANREDWIKSANDGRTALPIVQHAYKLAPHNYDVLLGMGIYNYYADLIPSEYPMVKPLMMFFPDGDRVKGLQQLKEAAEKATYANVEASYFLMQLMFQYEKQYSQALEIAIRLHNRFPNNVLFHRYVGRCRAAIGQWEEMKKDFDTLVINVKAGKQGFNFNVEREALYYLGMYDMQYARYDSALQKFYRVDELSRNLDKSGPSGFMAMTNLKIGMIYDLQAKREYAIQQYKKVLDMKEYQGSHTQAKRFLTTPYNQ